MVAEYLRQHPYIDDDRNVTRRDFIDVSILGLDPDARGIAVDRDVAWKVYLQKIAVSYRCGGIMGEEIALQGLSEMLQASITVYRNDGINFRTYGIQHAVGISLGFIVYDIQGCPEDETPAGHYCAFMSSAAADTSNFHSTNRQEQHSSLPVHRHRRTLKEKCEQARIRSRRRCEKLDKVQVVHRKLLVAQAHKNWAASRNRWQAAYRKIYEKEHKQRARAAETEKFRKHRQLKELTAARRRLAKETKEQKISCQQKSLSRVHDKLKYENKDEAAVRREKTRARDCERRKLQSIDERQKHATVSLPDQNSPIT